MAALKTADFMRLGIIRHLFQVFMAALKTADFMSLGIIRHSFQVLMAALKTADFMSLEITIITSMVGQKNYRAP